MKNYTIFIDLWQMQCCGIPFGTGSRVRWIVERADHESYVSKTTDIDIDLYYEEHTCYEPDRFFILEGTVREVSVLYEKMMPAPEKPRYMIPTEGITVRVSHSSEYKDPLDGRKSYGYIVSAENCTLRPAEEREVTFC